MTDIFGLAGHRALVVGGGYGSGRLTAKLLAEAGARVAVADIDADRAEAVASEIGGLAVVGDVTTPEGAAQVVDKAHELLGGLTRLANIVGLVKMEPFIDNSSAHWRQQMDLNASMSTTMTERFNVSGALLVKLFGDRKSVV